MKKEQGTGELIFICRNSDGKFSRQIKVNGLQKEIHNFQTEISAQQEHFEARLCNIDAKINLSIFSGLYFLFKGFDSSSGNITDREKNLIIPLAEKLISAITSWRQDLSFKYQNGELSSDWIIGMRLTLVSLIDIYQILVEKNNIAKLLSSTQLNILDDLIISCMKDFNNIANYANKRLQQCQSMSNYAKSDLELFVCFIVDFFTLNNQNGTILQFRLEDISNIKKIEK